MLEGLTGLSISPKLPTLTLFVLFHLFCANNMRGLSGELPLAIAWEVGWLTVMKMLFMVLGFTKGGVLYRHSKIVISPLVRGFMRCSDRLWGCLFWRSFVIVLIKHKEDSWRAAVSSWIFSVVIYLVRCTKSKSSNHRALRLRCKVGVVQYESFKYP